MSFLGTRPILFTFFRPIVLRPTLFRPIVLRPTLFSPTVLLPTFFVLLS